jgi:hypothetical protein
MALQRVVLGLVVLWAMPLTLQLQHVAKGGLKKQVLGWLPQVMMLFSSSNLSMGIGSVRSACKFFFFLIHFNSFLIHFLLIISTGDIGSRTKLSMYILIR